MRGLLAPHGIAGDGFGQRKQAVADLLDQAERCSGAVREHDAENVVIHVEEVSRRLF